MEGDCIHLCPASVNRSPEGKEGGEMWAKIGEAGGGGEILGGESEEELL